MKNRDQIFEMQIQIKCFLESNKYFFHNTFLFNLKNIFSG